MKGYSLYSKKFEICKYVIYLIPTIEVTINDYMLALKTFTIEFHFLCFHARLLWVKDMGLNGSMKRYM